MQSLLSIDLKKFSNLAVVSVATLSFLIPTQALAATSDVLGDWYNDTKESKIQIYKSGNKYFGKIVWLREPNKNGKPKVDDKNPDKNKQKNPLMNLVILRDLKNVSDDKWEDGKVYDPKNGKEYSCEMKLKNAKTLDLRGYIGFSLLGRTSTWTKP